MTISEQTKEKMQAAVDHFKMELRNLRSNRAHPGMVEGVVVDVYGSSMRLKELASINTPEPRQIVISPFDPQTADAIVKGIDKANINLRGARDGNVIRVNVPPMDQSMRQEIVKQGKKKAEDTKIAIREIRRKNNDLIRKQKAEGIVTEDVMKKTEKTIQEFTDQFCRQVDDLFAAKEKELLTV